MPKFYVVVRDDQIILYLQFLKFFGIKLASWSLAIHTWDEAWRLVSQKKDEIETKLLFEKRLGADNDDDIL